MKVGQGFSSNIFQGGELIHNSIRYNIGGSVNCVSNFDSLLDEQSQILAMYELVSLPMA